MLSGDLHRVELLEIRERHLILTLYSSLGLRMRHASQADNISDGPAPARQSAAGRRVPCAFYRL